MPSAHSDSGGKEGMRLFMKKWEIILLGAFVFVISIIFSFMINSKLNISKNKEHGNTEILAEDNKNDTVKTATNDVIVSPNAEIILIQKYKRCGHTVTTKEMAPREIVNLNEEKVKEYYKGWNVDKFSSNEIQLSRINDGICGEHYIIRESDGFISISCKNDSGEYIFKGLTDISVQYLPEEDLNKLQKGIEVVGKEALNKFLEDFE